MSGITAKEWMTLDSAGRLFTPFMFLSRSSTADLEVDFFK
jgi:hypothetical protein